MPRESAKARQAWADYLALGDARSLEALVRRYQTEHAGPTRRLATLAGWSVAFGWQERIRALADQAVAEAETTVISRRREILETGLALDYERVDVLKRVAAKLLDEIENQGRLWLLDVKSIGSGEFAERVDIERFNAAEVEQLRGLLDDIAKEKSERTKTVRVDVEHRIRTLAEAAGVDPEAAVLEAQRILAEAKG